MAGDKMAWPKKVSRFTPAIRQAMADMYLAGKTSPEVAAAFGTDKSTVCQLLASLGIPRRTNSEAKTKYHIREHAFEQVIDEPAAYWLGFLYADGYIYERRNGREKGLTLVLQGADISHLQKFASFLGGNPPIRPEKRYATCGIHLYSVRLAADLIKWGCIPNKSEASLHLPTLPSPLLLHFVRGYFDGDGSAYDTSCPTLSFCGSETLLWDIKEYITKETGERGFMTGHSKSHVYYLIYRGAYKANIVGKWLYQNATIYLDRKYEKIHNFSQPKRKRTPQARWEI